MQLPVSSLEIQVWSSSRGYFDCSRIQGSCRTRAKAIGKIQSFIFVKVIRIKSHAFEYYIQTSKAVDIVVVKLSLSMLKKAEKKMLLSLENIYKIRNFELHKNPIKHQHWHLFLLILRTHKIKPNICMFGRTSYPSTSLYS